MQEMTHLPETILFYDGVCNFCDSTVQFVLRFDSKRKFVFCPLQSEFGQNILRKHGYHQIEMNTLVMLHRGNILTESTAVLTTLKILGGLWRGFYGFMIVPPKIRNGFYQFIARNRYRFFGQKEACRIPDQGQREQFLEF